MAEALLHGRIHPENGTSSVAIVTSRVEKAATAIHPAYSIELDRNIPAN